MPSIIEQVAQNLESDNSVVVNFSGEVKIPLATLKTMQTDQDFITFLMGQDDLELVVEELNVERN